MEEQVQQSCGSFGSQESFERSRRHMLSSLVGFGRHTITGLVRTQNRQQQDWTADYRFYSQDRFDEEAIFDLVRKILESHLQPKAPLVVAMDDSLLRKTGRHIQGVRYLRDPLSPPFNVNLVRGLRVLQCSAALPEPTGAARMIPVDFQRVVLPPKPAKNATKEQLDAYEQERSQRNIDRLGMERIKLLRQQMDNSGSSERRLVVVVDGRFTNSTVLKAVPERTVLLGRLRKDAVLHYLPQEQPAHGRKRKYGQQAPTPEQLLKHDTVPWQTVRAYACGQAHEFPVKSMGPSGHENEPGPHARTNHGHQASGVSIEDRQQGFVSRPAFLVCTDPQLALEEFLQDYLWRWDIEVNFRDEKTILGVGQGQVPHRELDSECVRFGCGGLCDVAVGGRGVPDRQQRPKWYKRGPQHRATTNELTNQLRIELWASALKPGHFSDFMTKHPDQKAQKSEFNPAAAMFATIR